LTIGGKDTIKKNLSDKDIVKKLVKELKQNKGFYKKLILVDIDNKYKVLKGRTFESIAQNMGLSIEETIVKILSMAQRKVIVLNQNLSLTNIDKGIKNIYSIIASNGMSLDLNNLSNGFCDQRSTGSFIKFLSTYKNILPFESLIYKITGLVKNKLGLKNKGNIKIGMDADLVILNPQNIFDQSTIQNPMLSPKGVETVIINGEIAYSDGKIVKEGTGKIIVRSN
jgi:N-acyl-D-aspartate/D-glutamate deacylase